MKKSEFGAGLFISLFILGFALLFIYGGVTSGTLLYLQMRDAWAAKSYVPVPAQVESVRLEEYSSKKAGTRYRTIADFSYTFEGRLYQSHRVDFNRTTDDSKSYQKTMYEHLLAAQMNHRPVELWVDPGNPEQSVHDRTIRWDMTLTYLLVGSICMFIGIKVLIFLYRGWRRLLRGDNAVIADKVNE